MTRVRWLWATPPDVELRRVARAFERGELPAGAVPIKKGRNRSVWSAPHTAGGLVLKSFSMGRRDAVRSWVWPSRARREYRMMESFCRAGVQTVRPVACGERLQHGAVVEAWFLGRWVQGAVPLDAALRNADANRVAWLAARAMELAGQMHTHPFLHRDLHAGNLILDGSDHMLVTDLHSVWGVPFLTRGMRVRMLARLLFSMRGSICLDGCASLLVPYARVRGEQPEHLVVDVLAAIDAFERDYVRGRTARCVRVSSEYRRDRIPPGRVFRRREYSLEQLEADLAAHRRVAAQGGAALLGDNDRSQVTLHEGARVVKSYRPRGLGGALRQALGRGRARSAWMAARRLAVLDIPTPEALALLECSDGSAFLVSCAVTGVSLRSCLEGPLRPDCRRALARAAGHLVGRLSRAGLRHDDLSTKNLLVSDGTLPTSRDRRTTPPAGLPRLAFIDLDNLCRMRVHDRRGLARMLGQLGDVPACVSRTDRLAFVRAYQGSAGRGLPHSVVRRAAALTSARRARRERATRSARAG